MSVKPSKHEKLAALFEHHYSHEPTGSVPFVNLMIDNETGIQYCHWGMTGTGEFTVTEWAAETCKFENIAAFAHDSERFEPSDFSEHGINLIHEEGPEDLIETTEHLLGLSGRSLEDLTFAVEEDCPDNKRTTWDDFFEGDESSKSFKPVDDVADRIRGLYDYLQYLDDQFEGTVPDPFPVAYLYVDGEMFKYNFSPNVHTLDSEDDAEREAFGEFVESRSDSEVVANDSNSVSVTQYDWSAENATAVTEALFEEFFETDLVDITYGEITHGENEIGWDKVDDLLKTSESK